MYEPRILLKGPFALDVFGLILAESFGLVVAAVLGLVSSLAPAYTSIKMSVVEGLQELD